MAQYVDHGTPLAVETCRKAIENADATPDEIEKVVFVSSSGFTAPGIDNYVVEQLGLPRTVSPRPSLANLNCAIDGFRSLLSSFSNFLRRPGSASRRWPRFPRQTPMPGPSMPTTTARSFATPYMAN